MKGNGMVEKPYYMSPLPGDPNQNPQKAEIHWYEYRCPDGSKLDVDVKVKGYEDIPPVPRWKGRATYYDN